MYRETRGTGEDRRRRQGHLRFDFFLSSRSIFRISITERMALRAPAMLVITNAIIVNIRIPQLDWDAHRHPASRTYGFWPQSDECPTCASVGSVCCRLPRVEGLVVTPPSIGGATRKWLALRIESVNAGHFTQHTTCCVGCAGNRLNAVSHMWIAGKSHKSDSTRTMVNFLRHPARNRYHFCR